MNNTLHRLVYRSRNASAAHDLDETVRAILAASQRNNAACGVTGALLFNSGCFGQVLEGATGDVEATFERIQRDPRHSDVAILSFEPAPARAFPNWSMGFVGANARDRDRFAGISDQSGFDASRMDGDELFALLRQLAIEEESEAPGSAAA